MGRLLFAICSTLVQVIIQGAMVTLLLLSLFGVYVKFKNVQTRVRAKKLVDFIGDCRKTQSEVNGEVDEISDGLDLAALEEIRDALQQALDAGCSRSPGANRR